MQTLLEFTQETVECANIIQKSTEGINPLAAMQLAITMRSTWVECNKVSQAAIDIAVATALALAAEKK